MVHTLDDLFAEVDRHKTDPNTNVEVSISFLEIYHELSQESWLWHNEIIKDLLVLNSVFFIYR